MTTVAGGGTGSQKGYVDGMGSEALFDTPWGMVTDKQGNVLVADIYSRRVRKITFGLAKCTDLAGISKYTAVKSCKAAQKQEKWSGTAGHWVDPNGDDKADAWKTVCDQTNEGGGWTKVTQDIAPEQIDLLRGTSGRVMYKCSDAGPGTLTSPVTTQPWSWTKKAKAPGDWLVDGQPAACGGDAAFGQLSCGFGWGCSSGKADPTAFVLPGIANGNQCSNTTTVNTGKSVTVCGDGSHGTYSVFVRTED
jgi:hypothetical protein